MSAAQVALGAAFAGVVASCPSKVAIGIAFHDMTNISLCTKVNNNGTVEVFPCLPAGSSMDTTSPTDEDIKNGTTEFMSPRILTNSRPLHVCQTQHDPGCPCTNACSVVVDIWESNSTRVEDLQVGQETVSIRFSLTSAIAEALKVGAFVPAKSLNYVIQMHVNNMGIVTFKLVMLNQWKPPAR